MQDFEEFRANTIKLYGKGIKKFKISNSYKAKDIWRWIKKNKWLDIGQPITEKEFGLIVKTYHLLFCDRLSKGLDVVFPHRMGKLELRKYYPKIEIVDGKVRTTLPIDWVETLKYWSEDGEAKKSKKLIRRDSKEVFRIGYKKRTANYANKLFYQFSPARSLKLKLRDKAWDNKLEAFLI